VVRLHDEHIATANAVCETWAYFSVCKLNDVRITKFDAKVVCDFLS